MTSNASKLNLNFLEQESAAINEIAIISRSDKFGIIQFANENFCKLSGYTAEELKGSNHNIVNSGFHSPGFFQQMWSEIRQGKSWRGLICNKSKSGQLYWVDSYILPILDDNGEVQEYISFRFDVTAAKSAEVQLENEKMKSIHLSRLSALGEMAAGIAHEINNPLAVLQAQLCMIEKTISELPNNKPQAEKIQKVVDKSKNQIQRIATIIGGIKNFSRSSEMVTFSAVSVETVFSAVQELCADRLKDRNIKIEFKTIADEFECNRVQIEQVLVNLINNAGDAIESLPEKWIIVEARLENCSILISVTDSGGGISRELAKKILQPFFTTKGEGKGTGLGLSISKDIIESHGGTLEIDFESAHTRFVLTIPVSEQTLLLAIDKNQVEKEHRGQIENTSRHNGTECSLAIWIERVSKRFKDDQHFLNLKTAHAEFHKIENEIWKNSQDKSESTGTMANKKEKLKYISERMLNELNLFLEAHENRANLAA